MSYYWPPAGGSGVQRVSKFCKYLAEFGYDPIVLTVKDGNYPSLDQSLLKDVARVDKVYRASSLEPHAIYRALLGRRSRNGSSPGGKTSEPSEDGGGWKRKLGEWIRLNLFIPDSRIGWKRPAIAEGLRLIREHQPDVIFSTAPPYTPHLIAKALHKKTGIPWVADFRDPWLENHAYNTAPRLRAVLAANRWLEKGVLMAANRVTATNPGLADILKSKLAAWERRKVRVIYNGYDQEETQPLQAGSPRFELSYFGTMYRIGFPDTFFESLGRILQKHADFARDLKFNVFGQIHPDIRAKLVATILGASLDAGAYLPHDDYLKALYRPQALVVLINEFPHNEATVPGKIYEYLPTGNPILCFGPQKGDVADILETCHAGQVLDPLSPESFETALLDCYTKWRTGILNTGPRQLPQFERREQAKQLAALFDELTGRT